MENDLTQGGNWLVEKSNLGILLLNSDSHSSDFKNGLARESHKLLSELSPADTENFGRGKVLFTNLDNRSLVIRAYRRGGLIRYFNSSSFLGSLGNSRIKRELEILAFLRSNNVSVVEPIAGFLKFVLLPIIYRGAIVTLRVEGARNAIDLWSKEDTSIETVKEQSRQVAKICTKMLKLGIYHKDLHPGNVLIDPVGRAIIIDFDGATRFSDDLAKKIENRYLRRWQRGCKKHLGNQRGLIAVSEFLSEFREGMK